MITISYDGYIRRTGLSILISSNKPDGSIYFYCSKWITLSSPLLILFVWDRRNDTIIFRSFIFLLVSNGKRNNKNKSKNKIYYPHIIWPKCVNLWVAGTGNEPVSLGYEPNVLPLYHPAIYLGFLWTKLKVPLETWTLLTGLQNRGIAIYAYRPFINSFLCI